VSSFWQRALVSLTLGPLGLVVIYFGGWIYFIPVALLLLAATFEYARLMRHMGWEPVTWVLVPAVFMLWLDSQVPDLNLQAPALAASLFLAMVAVLWRYEKRQQTHVAADWLVTLAGILLLGWLASHFFRLRLLDPAQAMGWTALAMIATWTTDMGAYTFGRQFGRRKMTPRLSPKKTVVGYVAGIVCGTLFTYLFALLFAIDSPGLAALLGGIVGSVSPAGDLAISLLKREAGVKDSGHIFPGHGGALDRIDSLLWGITITYYLILYVS
jgi:phosphatidate cytidylyltransferase